MTLERRTQLAERGERIVRKVPRGCHRAVERGHRVALAQHDAIAFRPLGPSRIVAQTTEYVCYRQSDHREGAARMAGARVGQHANDLHAAGASDGRQARVIHRLPPSCREELDAPLWLPRVGNGIDAYVADRDLRGVHDLVRRPDDRALDVLGDADDVVEERGDVVVDPDRVRLDGLPDPTVANHIRIRGDRTGEITGAQPVDRV